MAAVADALAPLDVVDGSISGPPPSVRPGATVYLSGPRAAEIAALPWTGVRPTVVGAGIGAASAVKMCTASVQKGLWALVGHAMATAAANGVLDPVLADVAAFLGVEDLARPVASGATKAHRYVAEMREIAATQRAAGLPGELFDGFAVAYRALARTALADGDPEGVGSVPPREVVRLMGARTSAGSRAGGR
jgi:3-hydroxyisobutyrate dehydrogenase-like beta-hydroxyacid dehydrogenase